MYFSVKLIEQIVNNCPKDDRELRYFLRYKRYSDLRIYQRLIKSLKVKDLNDIKTLHISNLHEMFNDKEEIIISDINPLISMELKIGDTTRLNLEWDKESYNSTMRLFLYVSDNKRYIAENMTILTEYLKLGFNISLDSLQKLKIMDRYIRQEINIAEIDIPNKTIIGNISGNTITFSKKDKYYINFSKTNIIDCKEIEEVRDSLERKGYDCDTIVDQLKTL